jgi:hypothetical protein
VFFAHPSHDYWRTELASEVRHLEEQRVKYSAYHSTMQTVDEDEDTEAKQDGSVKDALVLRS